MSTSEPSISLPEAAALRGALSFVQQSTSYFVQLTDPKLEATLERIYRILEASGHKDIADKMRMITIMANLSSAYLALIMQDAMTGLGMFQAHTEDQLVNAALNTVTVIKEGHDLLNEGVQRVFA